MRISSAIAGNLLTSLFGRIIGAFGPILLIPLMIHSWGLEVYGEWLILTAIPAYIMLSPDFGLAGAVVNRMAYLTAQGHEQEAIYLYRSAWITLVCAAAGFVGVGWLVAWWVDWSKFGVKILEPTIAISIIGWSCVQIFIAQQGFLLSGIYKSARLNPRLGLLGSLSGAFILGVSIFVLWLGGSPYQYVVVIALANAIFFIVLFMDSRRIMPSFTLSLQGVSLEKIRPYIVPGLGHAGMPLLHALQNQGTLIVLGAIFGSVSVAIFQTVRILSNGVKALLGILSSAIMVELPSLLGDNQKEIVQHLLVRNFQIGLIATFFAILTMIYFGEDIYKLWLGKAGFYDRNLTILLFISLMPFTISSSFNIFLLASNNIHRTIIPMLGAAIFSILILTLSAHWTNFSIVGVVVLFWEILLAVIAIIYASKMNELDIQKMTKDFFNLNSIGKDINQLSKILVCSILSWIKSLK